MNTPRRRHVMLFLAFAASLGAAAWVNHLPSEDGVIAAPIMRTNGNPVAETQSDAENLRLPLERLQHRAPNGTDVDPFHAKVWFVAPPPAPPPPPPKPAAPPLPFKFMGSFEDPATGKLVVYLARGEDSFPVSPGDKFDDNQYQFNGIERDRIAITYLPLSVKQNLTLDTP